MTNVSQTNPVEKIELAQYRETTRCLARLRALNITLDGDRSKLSRLIMCRFRTANAVQQSQSA